VVPSNILHLQPGPTFSKYFLSAAYPAFAFYLPFSFCSCCRMSFLWEFQDFTIYQKIVCVCVCVYPSKTVTVHIIAKVCKPYHFYTLLILPPDREVLENIWCVLNIQNLKKSVAPATDNIIYSEFFSLIYTGNVNSLVLSQLHVYISNDKCVIWGFGTRLHDVLLLMEEISPFLRFVTKCFTLECLTMFLIWYRK
jgi:hypothetical protein